MKRTLFKRNLLNRKIDETHYFPFANGQCLVIKSMPVNNEREFKYDEIMQSVVINFTSTGTIEDIKYCNFEPSDLLSDELYTLLEGSLQAFRIRLNNRSISDAINSVLKAEELNQKLLLDFFTTVCPNTTRYLKDTFNFYDNTNTTDNIAVFLLLLMTLTTTKTLSDEDNERYVLQKAIMLTGDGQTGKSSLLNFFAMLSLNAHQAVEVSHINNRFESYA